MSERCIGYTKSGKRCKRKALPNSEYCKTHDPELKSLSKALTTLNPLELLQPDPKQDDLENYQVIVMRADKYREKREKTIKYLLSGTPLDYLMQIASPGWETSSVYLVYGANNTGKTQLCNTMAVLNEYDVIWIDGGEDTFRPERLEEIARLRELPSPLERIHVVHALNASHLEAICSKLPEIFMEFTETEKGSIRTFKEDTLKTGKIGLVILDSIAPTFRTQYQGRENLAPRQQALMRTIMYLRLMSQWFNCVIIVTDQIIEDPRNTFAFGGPWVSQKPVGGPTVTHNFDFQLRFRPAGKNVRVATIMDSSNTPMGEIQFKITERGIEPVGEE